MRGAPGRCCGQSAETGAGPGAAAGHWERGRPPPAAGTGTPKGQGGGREGRRRNCKHLLPGPWLSLRTRSFSVAGAALEGDGRQTLSLKKQDLPQVCRARPHHCRSRCDFIKGSTAFSYKNDVFATKFDGVFSPPTSQRLLPGGNQIPAGRQGRQVPRPYRGEPGSFPSDARSTEERPGLRKPLSAGFTSSSSPRAAHVAAKGVARPVWLGG